MRTWNLRTGIEIDLTDDQRAIGAANALAIELAKDGFPVLTNPPHPPDKSLGQTAGMIWVMVNPRPLPQLGALP
jgi:hypothetical protein